MKNNALEERLIDFSVLIIDIVNEISKTKAGYHLAGQIIRSGTSFVKSIKTARQNLNKSDV